MTFPVYFTFGNLRAPAHAVMETAGYVVGSGLFWFLRRKFPSTRFASERGLIVIVACLFGAFWGSKILALIENIHAYWPYRHDLAVMMGAKTIVGGLAGGWVGVEIAKWRLGIRQKTGDRFVFPVLIGLAIGRVGCFLTGLPDHTYGVATSLPWGVDFGDGIHRHPTQLYESIFCLILAGALWLRTRSPYQNGEIFQLMVIAYLSWRFLVEFIKPRETYAGLSPIQLVSFVTVCAAVVTLRNLHVQRGQPAYG